MTYGVPWEVIKSEYSATAAAYRSLSVLGRCCLAHSILADLIVPIHQMESAMAETLMLILLG